MGIRSLSGYFVVWLLVFADLWCRAPGFHVPLSPRKMQVQSGVIFKLITCSKCGGDDIRLCKPQPYRRRMTGQDSEVTKEHLSFITTPAASPVSAKKTSTLYNIPNILTVLRLLSVPLFMYTAFQNRVRICISVSFTVFTVFIHVTTESGIILHLYSIQLNRLLRWLFSKKMEARISLWCVFRSSRR